MTDVPPPQPSPVPESPRPAAPRYSNTAAPMGRRPFAYQAVAYAFWAPLVAIALGFCVSVALNRPGAITAETLRYVSNAIWIVDGVIIVSALVLGIFALISMRKLGKRELLIRGSLGVVFAAVLGGSMGWRYLHPPPTPADRLVGKWVTMVADASGKKYQLHLVLNKDGSAHWLITGATAPIDVPAHWAVVPAKQPDESLVLVMKPDVKAPDAQVAERFWRIESIEKNELHLTRPDANGRAVPETYTREAQ